MIGRAFSHGSFARRMVMRALVVFGAVWIGGIVMRSLPHDQVLVFPVGSVFPNATHFSASWKTPDDDEPRGGVTLDFDSATPAPLQVREHTSLPNGDYVVSVEVVVPDENDAEKAHENGVETGKKPASKQSPQRSPRGVETNAVRRVSLSGGETLIALAAGGF